MNTGILRNSVLGPSWWLGSLQHYDLIRSTAVDTTCIVIYWVQLSDCLIYGQNQIIISHITLEILLLSLIVACSQ